MKSDRMIRRELRRLRKFIDGGLGSDVETRVAYAIETAIRWAREDTVGWEKPLEDAMATAQLIEQERRTR